MSAGLSLSDGAGAGADSASDVADSVVSAGFASSAWGLAFAGAVKVAMMAAKYAEKAVAMNHPPITVLTSRFGDSFVTMDSPTGDKQSSPVVWRR